VARNLPDGDVEVLAEGDLDALSRFERALSRGPTMARVERVEKSELPHEISLPKSFETE
jgi:acylphosphatase